MEGRAERSSGKEGEPVSSGHWRDLALLALLLAAAAGLRAWLICHTEVAARDSIGFIRYALQFENAAAQGKSWADVVRANHQHPAYPLTVLAISVPVRAFGDAPLVDLMRLSAQLASSLASVLLVIPMYYLGKLLFNRATGFWAVLMFQCLPVTGHILGDGLSEALFLLLTASALLFAAQALHNKSPLRFALCGAFCGLSYLTRPEGALVLAATGLSLICLQFAPLWRRTWRNFLASQAYLILAALAAGSPYFLATGCFSTKPSVGHLMGKEMEKGAEPLRPKQHRAEGPPSLPSPHGRGGVGRGGPLLAAVPAVVLSTDGPTVQRLARGLWGLGTELVNGFHYVGWVPALIGLCLYLNRPSTTTPGMWPLLLLCLFHALVLWRLAVVVGYLSDRHIQVIVLCGIYPAAMFLLDLPARLRGWLRAWGLLDRVPAADRLLERGGPALSLLLLVGLTGTGLPKTLHALHPQRAGHHAAGLWLAEHTHLCDTILDRHAWAHYYAGFVFREGQPPVRDPGHQFYYYVVGKTKDGSDPELPSQELFLSEKQLTRRGAVDVYHWPPGRPLERAAVIIYRLRDPNDVEAERLRQISFTP
jgi:4-amino-4-deoxy-L-arabinose transferase-like glycosyltransferase